MKNEYCNQLDAGSTSDQSKYLKNLHWMKGHVRTQDGDIPLVSTRLNLKDHIGKIRVRFGIKRMKFRIEPGLYGIGNPDADSPVFVTANYKLSFDSLRKELDGMNGWILVLDSKGINVWCAAGKGTFRTEELIKRVAVVRLNKIVSHRILILPQLSAPGIAAHEITKATQFNVKYGPVLAKDIKSYLNNGMKATPDMRKVSFGIKERIVLVPVEIIQSLYLIPIILAGLMLIHLIKGMGISIDLLREASLFMLAILTGTLFVTLLLPWIPFRSFVIKGWVMGILVAIIGSHFYGMTGTAFIANLLFLPPISSFLALNLTGVTTFTSLSGVQKEILYGIPAMTVSVIGGIIVSFLK